MVKCARCHTSSVPFPGTCISAIMAFVQHPAIRQLHVKQVVHRAIRASSVSIHERASILGRFGFLTMGAPTQYSFTLDIGPGGIDGINRQCLTYHYYLPKIDGTQQNIRVRKQEPGGSRDIIDTVTGSPFNGWIKQVVSFNVTQPGYTVIA